MSREKGAAKRGTMSSDAWSNWFARELVAQWKISISCKHSQTTFHKQNCCRIVFATIQIGCTAEIESREPSAYLLASLLQVGLQGGRSGGEPSVGELLVRVRLVAHEVDESRGARLQNPARHVVNSHVAWQRRSHVSIKFSRKQCEHAQCEKTPHLTHTQPTGPQKCVENNSPNTLPRKWLPNQG